MRKFFILSSLVCLCACSGAVPELGLIGSYVASYGGETATLAGWVSEVEQTWLGQLRLCFDSDVGYCYVKHGSQ